MAVTSSAQQREDRTLARAQRIIDDRWKGRGETMTPSVVRMHFALRMIGLEREVFDVAFLDARLQLIGTERMFMGDLKGSEVHPREVVRAALLYNAEAVIVAHNHPSGVVAPSAADKAVTARLRQALALVDIRLLDHIIVGGRDAYSFVDNGLDF